MNEQEKLERQRDFFIIENVCTWPDCDCQIPSWAFSKEIRISRCEEVKKAKGEAVGP